MLYSQSYHYYTEEQTDIAAPDLLSSSLQYHRKAHGHLQQLEIDICREI